MKKTEPLRFEKGDMLRFVSRNEDEEIIKSSNNRQEGILKTNCKSKKRRKEYTVDFVIKSIDDGSVLLIKKAIA
jgi:hypothetical protein